MARKISLVVKYDGTPAALDLAGHETQPKVGDEIDPLTITGVAANIVPSWLEKRITHWGLTLQRVNGKLVVCK